MSQQQFVVGQRIECMDGNTQKWYYARIKQVETDRVLVQWSNPRWQSSKYDQWVVKAHYDVRIRPGKIQQQSYINRALYSVIGDNDFNDNPNSQSSHVSTHPNPVSQMRHIDDWSHEELCQWMCSLNGVSERNKKKIIRSIMTDEITGSDFNSSIEDMSDVRDALPDISDNGVKNVYIGLCQLRQTQHAFNIKPSISYDAPIHAVPAVVDDNNDQSVEDLPVDVNPYENQNQNATSDLKHKVAELLQKNKALHSENARLQQQSSNNEQTMNVCQQHNRKLIEENNQLKTVNASLEENCALLTKRCDELSTNVSSLKQQNNVSQVQKNARLNTEISNLKQQNSDLNEECKELKLELENIKHKYNQLVRRNNDYTTWDSDAITDWIIDLDKVFNKYENVLRKTLKDEEITGADLIYLDKNDLNRFGIKAFKHKQRIIEEIQKLTQRNNNIQNNDNIIAYNEGKQTAYIDK